MKLLIASSVVAFMLAAPALALPVVHSSSSAQYRFKWSCLCAEIMAGMREGARAGMKYRRGNHYGWGHSQYRHHRY